MARRHRKEGENNLRQESNRKKTMEGTDRGLHPTVDGQSLGERGVKGDTAEGKEIGEVLYVTGEQKLIGRLEQVVGNEAMSDDRW